MTYIFTYYIDKYKEGNNTYPYIIMVMEISLSKTSFFLKIYIYIYLFLILTREYGKRERDRETERERHVRERHRLVVFLIHSLTRDWTHSLGMCPYQKLNLEPFGVWNITPTNWATSPGTRPHSFEWLYNISCLSMTWCISPLMVIYYFHFLPLK